MLRLITPPIKVSRLTLRYVLAQEISFLASRINRKRLRSALEIKTSRLEGLVILAVLEGEFKLGRTARLQAMKQKFHGP